MNGHSHEPLVDAAIGWVSEHAARNGTRQVSLTGTTNLFETGLLDSLGLVDLIAFLEEQSGSQIDLLELDEKQMATLDGLCRAARSSR